jgi:hypothetical protein
MRNNKNKLLNLTCYNFILKNQYCLCENLIIIYRLKDWRGILITCITGKLININGNTDGITMEKKIKIKQKKNNNVSFLPTELPT